MEADNMSSLSGKRLLVLGGIRLHCEVIRVAQKMGVEVYVTDYNEPTQSPGKLIADKHFMVSTTDTHAVVELIQHERIDGVLVGYVDSLLPDYAEICKKASLPCYATREQFELFSNKHKFKKLMRKYDIPVIEEYTLTPALSEGELHKIQYLVMVKPVDSSGSRGICVCSNNNELHKAYANALAFSKTGEVLIERFVQGMEVTVFFLMQDGEVYLTAAGNRHTKKNQGEDIIALPVAYTYPAKILTNYKQEVYPKVRQMLQDAGVRNGMLFIQCLNENGVLYAYDLGLRLTGSLENIILSSICGFDPMEMMIHHALTGSMGASIANKVNPYLYGKYGWNISFLMAPGKIARLEGLEDIQKTPGVLRTVISHDVGDSLLPSDRGLLKQICMRVLGVSSTLVEMKRTMQRIQSIYHVYDSQSNDLLLPMLDIEEIDDLVHKNG
jgi:biotin carboxylase